MLTALWDEPECVQAMIKIGVEQRVVDTGADPGFSKGGSEHRSGSLKQGVWGAQPPRSYRVLHF